MMKSRGYVMGPPEVGGQAVHVDTSMAPRLAVLLATLNVPLLVAAGGSMEPTQFMITEYKKESWGPFNYMEGQEPPIKAFTSYSWFIFLHKIAEGAFQLGWATMVHRGVNAMFMSQLRETLLKTGWQPRPLGRAPREDAAMEEQRAKTNAAEEEGGEQTSEGLQGGAPGPSIDQRAGCRPERKQRPAEEQDGPPGAQPAEQGGSADNGAAQPEEKKPRLGATGRHTSQRGIWSWTVSVEQAGEVERGTWNRGSAVVADWPWKADSSREVLLMTAAEEKKTPAMCIGWYRAEREGQNARLTKIANIRAKADLWGLPADQQGVTNELSEAQRRLIRSHHPEAARPGDGDYGVRMNQVPHPFRDTADLSLDRPRGPREHIFVRQSTMRQPQEVAQGLRGSGGQVCLCDFNNTRRSSRALATVAIWQQLLCNDVGKVTISDHAMVAIMGEDTRRWDRLMKALASENRPEGKRRPNVVASWTDDGVTNEAIRKATKRWKKNKKEAMLTADTNNPSFYRAAFYQHLGTEGPDPNKAISLPRHVAWAVLAIHELGAAAIGTAVSVDGSEAIATDKLCEEGSTHADGTWLDNEHVTTPDQRHVVRKETGRRPHGDKREEVARPLGQSRDGGSYKECHYRALPGDNVPHKPVPCHAVQHHPARNVCDALDVSRGEKHRAMFLRKELDRGQGQSPR